MDRESRFHPLDDAGVGEQKLRQSWLLAPVSVGAGMLAGYLFLEDEPLGGLLLEVGAGLVLFAVLFYFERRFIVSYLDRAIESLSAPLDPEDVDTEQMPGDFRGDFGPLFIAQVVLHLLAAGDYEKAFSRFSQSLQLARAQAWLFNNQAELGIIDSNRESFIDRLVEPDVTDPLWKEFSSSEAAQYKDAFSWLDIDRLGWSQRRRIIGPGHEVVIAFTLPAESPHGLVITAPRAVENAIKLILEAVHEGGILTYRVAGVQAECPPSPGWPPTLWVVDEPVAQAVHPGITAVPIHIPDEEIADVTPLSDP